MEAKYTSAIKKHLIQDNGTLDSNPAEGSRAAEIKQFREVKKTKSLPQ